MVLSTNSGSFPSNSHVSAPFSILLRFGESCRNYSDVGNEIEFVRMCLRVYTLYVHKFICAYIHAMCVYIKYKNKHKGRVDLLVIDVRERVLQKEREKRESGRQISGIFERV